MWEGLFSTFLAKCATMHPTGPPETTRRGLNYFVCWGLACLFVPFSLYCLHLVTVGPRVIYLIQTSKPALLGSCSFLTPPFLLLHPNDPDSYTLSFLLGSDWKAFGLPFGGSSVLVLWTFVAVEGVLQLGIYLWSVQSEETHVQGPESAVGGFDITFQVFKQGPSMSAHHNPGSGWC